jgi:hypothetical protein
MYVLLCGFFFLEKELITGKISTHETTPQPISATFRLPLSILIGKHMLVNGYREIFWSNESIVRGRGRRGCMDGGHAPNQRERERPNKRTYERGGSFHVELR